LIDPISTMLVFGPLTRHTGIPVRRAVTTISSTASSVCAGSGACMKKLNPMIEQIAIRARMISLPEARAEVQDMRVNAG
jgi:hypothetical protein